MTLLNADGLPVGNEINNGMASHVPVSVAGPAESTEGTTVPADEGVNDRELTDHEMIVAIFNFLANLADMFEQAKADPKASQMLGMMGINFN